MGIYIYKTMAKHVKTGMGDVHEAKYVTKPSGYDDRYNRLGRGGKTGTYLVAHELAECEPVYQVTTGEFWYDSATDQNPVGYLKKGKDNRWMVTTIEPTNGDWFLRDLKTLGRAHVHESGINSSIEIRGQLTDDGRYIVRSAINGARKPTIEVKTEELAREAVDSLYTTYREARRLRNTA